MGRRIFYDPRRIFYDAGEIRKERYERAIKWLEGVARGQIVPALPVVGSGSSNSSATAGHSGFAYGSQAPLHHSW